MFLDVSIKKNLLVSEKKKIYDHNGYLFCELLLFWLDFIYERRTKSHFQLMRHTVRGAWCSIYHGLHTDESSISIFGEIGGVFTRVDDSI